MLGVDVGIDNVEIAEYTDIQFLDTFKRGCVCELVMNLRFFGRCKMLIVDFFENKQCLIRCGKVHILK